MRGMTMKNRKENKKVKKRSDKGNICEIMDTMNIADPDLFFSMGAVALHAEDNKMAEDPFSHELTYKSDNVEAWTHMGKKLMGPERVNNLI
jgi:hypothetical protein